MTAITPQEYKARRTKVLEHLKEANAKTIIRSGSQKQYSNDVHYPFRANSDFYYLTGFTEPDAAIVLDPAAEHPYTMYLRPKDPAKEIWDGFRAGLEGAVKNFAADKAFDIKDMPSEDFTDVTSFVHSLRKIKSEAEINLMREAAKITIQAHRVLNEIITPGIYEYELQAAIENIFRSKGANGWAYPSIVAAGANSCILHYIENTACIGPKDVVLVDAGCEYQYYASDVTRVYSANGGFSKQQQELYDIVLDSQKAAIKTVKPGVSFKETHEAACEVIAEGLASLGYIKDKNDADELKKYYMHSTGHPLGIDVHDVGVDRKEGVYETGMVVTVEPGVYASEIGVGIRIEDDVLVTDDGYDILTADLAK